MRLKAKDRQLLAERDRLAKSWIRAASRDSGEATPLFQKMAGLASILAGITKSRKALPAAVHDALEDGTCQSVLAALSVQIKDTDKKIRASIEANPRAKETYRLLAKSLRRSQPS
jgi:hypothetical protein